ncbi:MAG: hypothetical protein KGS72_02830 [Cyanobacteria bacterium REEB67]|nr:hypothetical protein [Cyanobacteria bacterium REEB67]
MSGRATDHKIENQENVERQEFNGEFEDAAAVKVFVATKEHLPLSAEIAAMYEEALGKGGLKAEGHEAYPDPDLFSEAGIRSTLESGERLIALAKMQEGGDVIVGAMVADKMSPWHVEFNSMAVPIARRGNRIGSAIVAGLADIIDQSLFTVNCTELVTHSLASQAAHFHNGFRAICGFGYCHYPHVFFKDHPESVLWVTRLQGKLIPSLKKFRSSLGRKLGKHALDVKHKLIAGQASGQVNLVAGRLDDQSLSIVSEVLKERTAYVPQRYNDLVQAILFQFEDILDRTVKSYTRPEPNSEPGLETGLESGADAITIDLKEGFAQSYLTFAPDFRFAADAIDNALAVVHSAADREKRFIKVCLPANNPETLKAADYLNKKGFVFHSYLPLYGSGAATAPAGAGLQESDGEGLQTSVPEFYDVLSLQWIKPAVVKNNPMPGETDSVIKLYGYPENLSGQILRTINREIHESTGDT